MGEILSVCWNLISLSVWYCGFIRLSFQAGSQQVHFYRMKVFYFFIYFILLFEQCFGSISFWFGPGSADPHPWWWIRVDFWFCESDFPYGTNRKNSLVFTIINKKDWSSMNLELFASFYNRNIWKCA